MIFAFPFGVKKFCSNIRTLTQGQYKLSGFYGSIKKYENSRLHAPDEARKFFKDFKCPG
jgi:hypothetical protein